MAQNGLKALTNWLKILAWLFLGAIFTAFWGIPILGVAELISHWLPVIALWIYGFLVVGFIISFLVNGLGSPGGIPFVSKSLFDSHRQIALGASVASSLASLVVFACVSGQFLRYWSMRYGGFAPGGDEGYWSWIRYSTSWIIDNVSANFGQVFGWSMSSIHPITQTTRVLVWIYNIMLDFLALTVLFQAVGLLGKYGDHL